MTAPSVKFKNIINLQVPAHERKYLFKLACLHYLGDEEANVLDPTTGRYKDKYPLDKYPELREVKEQLKEACFKIVAGWQFEVEFEMDIHGNIGEITIRR